MKTTQRRTSILIQRITPQWRLLLIGLILLASLALYASPWRKAQNTQAAAAFATFTVTHTNDSGAGSLRQAILDANATTAADTINFNIPTNDPGYVPVTGHWRIQPVSALPSITRTVTIDGTTQPGYSGSPIIELNGASAGISTNGFVVVGSGTIIRRLVINRFGGNGIDLSGNNCVIEGCYIGTDVTGNTDLGNALSGIRLNNTFNGITIGGTAPGAGNVISGNNEYGILLVGGGAIVQGNIIGLDVTGATDQGNSKAGIRITNFSAGNLIGGTAAGAGNLISGNDEDGVQVNASLFSPSTNTIQGNLIGTDVTGTLDRGNTRHGIAVSSNFLVIGGTTAAARNVIAANKGDGIGFDPGTVTNQNGLTVQGNYIGTDITGLARLGNSGNGIYIRGGTPQIGGTAASAGNVISANGGHGIVIRSDGATTPVVQGNFIGTDKDGLVNNLGNGLNGIKLGDAGISANNVTIGGITAAVRNVISGNNQNGIELTTFSSSTSIKGNYIGMNTLNGVQATQVNGVNTIGGVAAGEGNTITGNGENGVQVRSGFTGVAIRGNSIYDNAKLGIDLAATLPGGTVTGNDAGDGDGGPNLSQNFPVLDLIVQPCQVPGSLNSANVTVNGFGSTYPVKFDFFASATCDSTGHGPGEQYLGSAELLTAPGTFTFSFTPVIGKPVITATATDANGNTSEFSACRTAPVNQLPVITPGSVARVEGQPGANSTIANITDANQASNTLGITINGQPIAPSPILTVGGVTISNLAFTPAGALTADVVAACGATSATFSLAATDNCGATTTGTLTITVNPAPGAMANAGMDQAMCSTGVTTTFMLAGSAANGAAVWSVVNGPVSISNPGALNSAAVFTGTGTATLQLTVTGGCGMATDQVMLTVNLIPDADAGPDRSLSCVTASVTLNGSSTSPGASFSWSGPGGFTSNAGTPLVSAAGVYTLIVTSVAGCTASDTVTVTGDTAAPHADAGAGKTLTCSTTSVTLEGSSSTPGATFSWSGPDGFTSNAVVPTVSAAGLYTLTVTNPANGCTASDSVTVMANTAVPDATITVAAEVCADAVEIVASVPNAGMSAAYVWILTNGTVTSGQGSRTITFTAGASGNVEILVGVQGSNDCYATNTKTVTIKPSTTVSALADVSTTEGLPAAFTGTANGAGPFTFVWRKGATVLTSGGRLTVNSTATTSTLTINPAALADAGGYSVEAASACGPPVIRNATLTVNPANTLPTLSGTTLSVRQGDAIALQQIGTAGDSDQEPNTLTFQISNGGALNGVHVNFHQIQATGEVMAFVNADCNATNATFTIGVTDGQNVTANALLTVNVQPNLPPALSYDNPAPVVSGNSISVNPATGPSDVSYTLSLLSVSPNMFTGTVNVLPTGVVQINNADPPGVYTITIRATDNCGAPSGVTDASFTLMVGCPPIAAVSVTAPASGAIFPVGTPINFFGAFTAAAGQPHTANWNFISNIINTNQTGEVNEVAGTVTATHTFTQAGVYLVTLTVTNNCGNSGSANVIGPDQMSALVVVYDPSAGHVTGGGWINSPPGAYVADLTLTGKANFGFVSKYKNGASVPDGNTEFQFKAGNLNFKSTAYEWLVIAGARAQFKGSGKINNAGDYRFILTAIDGQINGGGGQDKFRIRIWNDAGGGLVYDNQLNAPDSDDPTTVLGGGSMVIHKNSGGNFALRVALVEGDFDGDGKSDLSIWRGADGNWLVANSSDGQVQATPWGASFAPYNDLAVSGDYDGDGKTDLAVFRRGGEHAGYWFIKRSSDSQMMSRFWGLPTDTPVPGDYDADGKTDVAIWRGSTGAWYVWRSSDGGVTAINWGSLAAGDTPVAGDYDGDGKTDAAVFRRGIQQGQQGQGGDWLIQRSSDGQALGVKWGLSSDVPVPGDYDGDGKTDVTVWRGAEAAWYILQSSNAAVRTVSLGVATPGEWAVPGDYDGDGKADAAIWHESTGMWRVKRSSDDAVITNPLGQSGDAPVAARRN